MEPNSGARPAIGRPVTLADKVSVAPGLQQVVGACTVLSNVVKTTADVAKLALHFTQLIFSCDAAVRIGLIFIMRDERKDALQHLTYIGIGIIRFIPVVGTIYSASVWYNASRF